MTDIFCETQPDALPNAVDREPWQIRLKAMGISQVDFAYAVGLTPTNLSEGLRGTWPSGVPQYLKALVLALERVPEADRAAWLAAARQARHTKP